MFKNFFINTRKPKCNFGGRTMLKLMNNGHNKMALWGLNKLEIYNPIRILDIGCGGGKNIQNLAVRYPAAHITGIDYSAQSVITSRQLNTELIENKRAEISIGDVGKLKYNNQFDIITAFETIYFWSNIQEVFNKILRSLKPNGLFMVCNELSTSKDREKWEKMIEMKCYSTAEIISLMENSGFSNIKCYKNNKNWIVCIGEKIN